jgi:hypothetical protein
LPASPRDRAGYGDPTERHDGCTGTPPGVDPRRRAMKGFRLASAALAAVGALALPLPASAERWDHYGSNPGYERGFRDGIDNGRTDARKHRRFDVARDGDYRDADNGYKGRYGSRWQYASSYRRGYERGYRQGFSSIAAQRDYRGPYSGDRYAYPGDAYDFQRDGRHRHRGRNGWCDDDHGRYDGWTREVPRW